MSYVMHYAHSADPNQAHLNLGRLTDAQAAAISKDLRARFPEDVLKQLIDGRSDLGNLVAAMLSRDPGLFPAHLMLREGASLRAAPLFAGRIIAQAIGESPHSVEAHVATVLETSARKQLAEAEKGAKGR